MEELPTAIPNFVHHALTQVLEVLGEVSVIESSRNEIFERLKVERNRSLEALNAFEIEKGNVKKILLKKKVAMNAMMQSVLNLKRTVNRVQREKSLFMKTDEGLVSGSWQTATSRVRVTDKILKPILPI